MESFHKARSRHTHLPRKAFAMQTVENRPYQLPPFKLDHLFRMSDSTGILQHAVFNVPKYAEGYCTDDNARAFILTVLMEELEAENAEKLSQLATSYLAFIWHALDQKSRRFRNFMDYSRQWLEKKGSEDSHARAVWALGTALGRSENPGFRNLCAQLFELTLPPIKRFTSPRAWAFALIAIHEYLRRFSGDRAVNTTREHLANKLIELYKQNSDQEWHWFETSLAYDNAKLPHGLILSGFWTRNSEMLDIGLKALRWLGKVQTSPSGNFAPVGSNGFYTKGGECARFDQQPVEAHSMVSACLEAYRVTNDPFWSHEARRAFEWFLGRNDVGLPLYDATSGGCFDALHADRVNQNQGAESSLAFYLSLAEMNLSQHIISVGEEKSAA